MFTVFSSSLRVCTTKKCSCACPYSCGMYMWLEKWWPFGFKSVETKFIVTCTLLDCNVVLVLVTSCVCILEHVFFCVKVCCCVCVWRCLGVSIGNIIFLSYVAIEQMVADVSKCKQLLTTTDWQLVVLKKIGSDTD